MALYIDTLDSLEMDARKGRGFDFDVLMMPPGQTSSRAASQAATWQGASSGWVLRICLLVALALVFALATSACAAAHVDAGFGGGDREPARAARAKRVPRVQTGYATFLAKSFHGDESASGEIFDRRKMVAAHRSLPFGTRVRVTNLENGRTVDVRIIDRGPYGQNYREGTIIDLSRAAATRLDMIEDGQVRVKVRILALGDEGYRSPRERAASPS